MSACCEVIKHLWALVAHHSGHKPKVTDEAMASLTLYPARRIKAEPITKRKAP